MVTCSTEGIGIGLSLTDWLDTAPSSPSLSLDRQIENTMELASDTVGLGVEVEEHLPLLDAGTESYKQMHHMKEKVPHILKRKRSDMRPLIRTDSPLDKSNGSL
ncbi:hypothetical protein Tco_1549471 [Tanacetum coccineum]